MTSRISPERAKELLEDAAPGPWEAAFGEAGVPEGWDEYYASLIMGRTRLNFVEYQPLEEEIYASFALAAAAPDLAQTIAEMHWEYAVQVTNDGGESWRFAHGGTKATLNLIEPCWWFRTEEEAQAFAEFRTTKRSSARVVRRLVTDVEVIE